MKCGRFEKLISILILLACSLPSRAGQTSCKPDYFTNYDFVREPSVWSPDHTKQIRLLKDFTIRVEANGKDLGSIELSDPGASSVLTKWSDDSQAFYVLEGYESMYGGQTKAYSVVGDKLQELQAPNLVMQEFAKHHYCEARGDNLFGIRWEKNSHRLLLMAQVYNTGDCGNEMGFSEGYLVDADTGVILKTYHSKKVRAMQLACWPDEWLSLGKKSK
jgi:hypothetical protein